MFETGPLATWFFHILKGEGLPAICIEARHAQKILGETLNKTDANDAEGLARLAETGFYKAVREVMLIRSLVAACTQLLSMTTMLTNQIRGLMKTFGLVVAKSKGSVFEANVERLLEGYVELAQIILPLLETWRAIRKRVSTLNRQLRHAARQNPSTRLLITIPGIGTITAISSVAAIEDPHPRLGQVANRRGAEIRRQILGRAEPVP